MDALICVGGILLVFVLIIFFYLLNTARKKVAPANTLGKKDYLPIYISLADKPQSIMQGMDKLKVDVIKTEQVGDKWR